MNFSRKIQKAINLAAEKHHGQMRKSSKLPYIVHPFSVMVILSGYTKNEEVLLAGLLHDLLEDVDSYGYDDLKKDFGDKVAEIVEGVSEDGEYSNGETDRETWQERKENYLNKISRGSEESLMICAADKVHNLRSMSLSYGQIGEEIWKDFNAPLERQLWYYEMVIKTLKRKLENEIVFELEKSFIEFKGVVNQE